jgi:lia operon protein LiaG
MSFDEKFNIKKIVIYLLGIMFITFGLGTLIMFRTGTNFLNVTKSNNSISDTKTNHSISDTKTNNSVEDTKTNQTIDDTKTSNLAGINEIDVDVSSSTINIIPEGTSQVKAHFYGDVTSSSDYSKPEIQCYQSGNTLVIKEVDNNDLNFGYSNSNVKLDVYIPSDYNKDAKLVSASGDINVNGYKFSKLDCNLSSGTLNMNNVSADTFNYSNSSGDLKADTLTTNTTTLDSSSGSININMFSGNLTSESSSGDSNIAYANFNNNIDMHSSSGEIVLTLPNSAQFNLDADASSGDITCDFPITVSGKNDDHKLQGFVGNGKNNIKLDGSSGDIKILH